MEEKLLPAEEQGAGKSLPLATRDDLNSKPEGIPAFDAARLQGRQTFSEAEKLKSRKIIEQLFKEGKSVSQSGFTLVYLPITLRTFYPVQAGFSVPKKHFKHAVDRNRIKRQIREVYRNHKFALYQKLVTRQEQLAIMFVYNGKKLPEFAEVTKAVTACMKKLMK